jgi:hypothetical protein
VTFLTKVRSSSASKKLNLKEGSANQAMDLFVLLFPDSMPLQKSIKFGSGLLTYSVVCRLGQKSKSRYFSPMINLTVLKFGNTFECGTSPAFLTAI